MSTQQQSNFSLYRQRGDLSAESLNTAVDGCLKQYFQGLNGMSPTPGMYDKIIAEVEKPLIENVLRYVRGNQVRAANILGINRNTLRKKINVLEINIQETVKTKN
jgi:two-component system nitrogen regulation response regulator GlnG